MAVPILDIVRWMATEARSLRDPGRLIEPLCAQLVLGGVPLTRAAWALQTHQTDTIGRGLTWREGKPLRDVTFPWEEITLDRFQLSPFRHLLFGGARERRRLLDPDCPLDYPVLAELREEGITDYVALPSRLRDGRVLASTWATTDDFGFDNNHLEALDAVADVLGLLMDLWD